MGEPGRMARRKRPAPQPMGRRLFIVIVSLASTLLVSGDNAERGLAGEDRLLSVRIDGFFDPERNFIDATARLLFAQPASDRRLWLAEGLQLNSVRGGTAIALDFNRTAGEFMMQCPGAEELEFGYSGCLAPNFETTETGSSLETLGMRTPVDECRFLSYVTDFYPHPRIDFAAMDMSIRVPSGWNCLASGALRSVKPEPASTTYTFENAEAKGMSLVIGRFGPIGTVPGSVPVRVYGWPGFRFENFCSRSEIERILAFYYGRFGALGVPELSILFRRGLDFSGVSYNGLVVLNVDESRMLLPVKSRKAMRTDSPFSLVDAETDLLLHELAHQWWGGLLSWKTAADNWITEGLATYSSLLYLRQCRGEKAYAAALRRLRSLVKCFAGRGAPVNGYKLKLLERDLKAYQALVYVKPTLMLTELAGAIGEDALDQRLRRILQDCRGRSLGTGEFLRLLSADDESLLARLNEWICCPGMPG